MPFGLGRLSSGTSLARFWLRLCPPARISEAAREPCQARVVIGHGFSALEGALMELRIHYAKTSHG